MNALSSLQSQLQQGTSYPVLCLLLKAITSPLSVIVTPFTKGSRMSVRLLLARNRRKLFAKEEEHSTFLHVMEL